MLFKISAFNRDVAWAVGSGNPGMGGADVVGTPPGGVPWVKRPPPHLTAGHLQGVWAGDATHVWVSGSDVGGAKAVVWRSADGGVTWEDFSTNSAVAAGRHLIGIAGWDFDRIWAVGKDYCVVSTTNGGVSWTYSEPPAGSDAA